MKELKRQSFLNLIVLLLAVLLSQMTWAQQNIPNAIIVPEDAFMFYLEQDVTGAPKKTESHSQNYYGGNKSYPQLYNAYQLSPVTFSSSNQGVATIDQTTGVITAVGIGSTTISAYFGGNDAFFEKSTSYTLTFTDDRMPLIGMGFGYSSTTASATYGDASDNLPTLSMGQLMGETVDYSSSPAGVVTVDGSGQVTIIGAGTTVITAKFNGNDYVKSGETSYTLTVYPKEVGLQWGTASFIYDGSFHVPTATATGLVGSDVCTVTVEGEKTDAGSYTATASSLSNANYTLPADKSISFTISKAASSVAFASKTANAKMGESYASQTATTIPSGLPLTYSSSNTDSYKLSVAKADAVDVELSFSSATATATYGDAAVNAPALNNPYQLPLVWTSSNKKVAKVNVSGKITIVGAGQAIISASFAGNEDYKAKAASFTLTVNKATASVTFASKTANAKIGESYASQTATTIPSGLPLTYSSSDSYKLSVAKADAVDVELSFSSATATATYGDAAVNAPALNNPHQLPLVWTSSNENVAMVNAFGDITIVGAGQAIIYASFAGNDEYQAKTIYFTLTVNKYPVSVAFATSAETATLGEDFVSPKATVIPSGITLVYSSSDPNVASVDAYMGEVTLLGEGTVMITAAFNGSDNFESASAYYYLTIEKATPRLEPIVKEVEYPLDVDAYFINADGSEVDLSNTIVNNILFTLKNQNSPEGDGYDTEDHCIVINTVTSTSTVNALQANNVEPGSADYASQFTGLSFLVPAGEGYIIVTSQEADGVYLMVKVGEKAPVAIHLSEMGDYSIPYKSDFLTMVRMWKGDSDAQSYASTRGKKKMADVRVTKVTYKAVSSNGIQLVSVDAFDDNHWYDLNGQRITQPVKKGVYIHGNRKVVIK